MNTLNFRNAAVSADDTVAIIQPNFTVRGHTTTIEQYREKEFRLTVGCQSGIVSKKNVENLIFELSDGKHQKQQVKLIVAKGKVNTIKSIKNIPKYLESSEAFLCSSNMKIYPKEDYVLLDHIYTPENEVFIKGTNGYYRYNGYDFTADDAKKLLGILKILKNHLIPEPVVVVEEAVAPPAVIEPGVDLAGTETPAPSIWPNRVDSV